MAKSVARALLIPCALAGLLIGTAGCASGPKTVSKSDVESQISQKMTDSAGNKPESVSCPDDLTATVGATLRCTLVDAGQTYGVNVTVTSVEGSDVKFDIKRDGQPITSTTTSPTS
jgi:Domain of unknown function (DUF4333)